MSADERTLIDVLDTLGSDRERGLHFIDEQAHESFIDYRSLRLRALSIATELRRKGLDVGGRVCLLLRDHQQFMLGFLGTVLAGGVAVPLASRIGASPASRRAYGATVRQLLDVAGARWVLCDADTEPFLHEALQETQRAARVVVLTRLSQTATATELPLRVAPDSPCFLQFTSGSTSLPKGVIVSHRNIVANAEAFLGRRGSIESRPDDVALGWLPLYHDMGMMCFALGPLVVNMPAVLMATELFGKRPWSWMSNMARFGASVTFAPNFAYELVARVVRRRDLEGLDLSRVRVAGCGAEPVQASAMRKFLERFREAKLRPDAMVPCYGMAEATVAISFHPHGTPLSVDRVDAARLRLGEARPVADETQEVAEVVSCGLPVTGHEVQIVDSRDSVLGDRQVGEVRFRGGSVTQGYFERPDATAEVYRGGWLYTGDLGYLVRGNLHLCGRLKDIVIANGVNYYPQDIEWAVSEACDLSPNRVVAFSVLRGGRDTVVVCVEVRGRTPEDLRTTIREAVQDRIGLLVHQVLILPRGSIPLTSSGKVQRAKTKRAFETGSLIEKPEPRSHHQGLDA